MKILCINMEKMQKQEFDSIYKLLRSIERDRVCRNRPNKWDSLFWIDDTSLLIEEGKEGDELSE